MKRTSLQSTLGILLIAAILVLVNMIANTRFFRVDLTDGNVFSLSKASKTVVANLDQPLTVKVFASKNLSPQLNDVKRFLNDLLSGYEAYGKGDFHYEFIDPGSDEDLEKEANEYRIPPFQENVWNKDKLELKKVYLGLVMLYGDKQESIPRLQGGTGLEYNITSMIKRLTSQQEMTIGFLTGHGEPDINQQAQTRAPGTETATMNQAATFLQGNYKTTTVDLAVEEMVPDELDALLIIGPTEKIPDDQLLKIDQYIMQGGSVGWMYSPVKTDLQQGRATDLRLGLDTVTKAYGFRVNSDLVADANSSMINIQQRQGFFTVQNTINYPFFPNIVTFAEDAIIVDNLETLNLFFPSSIDTTHDQMAGVNLEPIIFSGPRSMVQSGRYTINATQQFNRAMFDRANLVLGAQIEGTFKSAFAGKELPTTENGDPVVPAGQVLDHSPEGSRMFVIGDGNFLQDAYLSNMQNVYLLLNAVDWLVGDTDLIKLRTREISTAPLREISDGQKALWKYFNWFGPPFLIVLLGVVYWQVRRNRRYGE